MTWLTCNTLCRECQTNQMLEKIRSLGLRMYGTLTKEDALMVHHAVESAEVDEGRRKRSAVEVVVEPGDQKGRACYLTGTSIHPIGRSNEYIVLLHA